MFWSVWQVGNDPFVMLASLLLVPVICVWVMRARFASRSNRWLAVTAAVLYGVFAAFFFPWSLFSVYLRWAPLLALTIICVLAANRPLSPQLADAKTARRRRLGLIASLALIILLDGSILKGMIPWTRPVELSFPLENGLYAVTQGGSSFWVNYHYGEAEDFRYALDVVEVDALGRRAGGLLPASMESYRIYGEAVYSPCSGMVIFVQGGEADSPLFTSYTDDPWGNQIAIDCGGIVVRLEHLLINSVTVTKGQTLAAGDPIGRVGSSGASTEPHLHIQANVYDGVMIGGSLPITFNGRYLVRNALIRPVKSDEVK